MSNSLQSHGLSPWNSPGQNIGVDSFSLLQGIFPTQGSNLGLLHCRQILYHLSHQGTYCEVILTCLCIHVANTPSKPRGILSTPAGSLGPFWVVTTTLTSSSKCVLSVCFRT